MWMIYEQSALQNPSEDIYCRNKSVKFGVCAAEEEMLKCRRKKQILCVVIEITDESRWREIK